jgi:hypothetical protein
MSTPRHSKRFRIHDKWWTVYIGRPPEKETLGGQCRYDDREIWLHPKNLKSDALDIIAHECAHAVLPAIDEEHIEHLGTVISQVAGWVGKVNGGELTHGFSGKK